MNNVVIDTACYNSVLDVCVSCRAIKEAAKLFQQVKEEKRCDIITYNTLLKGYCKNNDFNSKGFFSFIA